MPAKGIDSEKRHVAKRILLLIVCLAGVAVLAFAGLLAIFYFSMVSTVMTKRSPDGQHTAKLVRVQGIDVNFRVTVDGSRIYSSPDFAPRSADFREHLFWDAKSEVVVLKVAGRRIFAYKLSENRPLTESELPEIELTPFEELGFEGD